MPSNLEPRVDPYQNIQAFYGNSAEKTKWKQLERDEERQERIPPCVPKEEIKKQSKQMTLSVLSDGVKKLHQNDPKPVWLSG